MKKQIKSINSLYYKYIIQTVDELIPTIRKKDYSNKYLLDMFIHVLNNCSSWRSLSLLSSYPKKNPNHYKYINQVFNKWNSFKIFEVAYGKLLNNHYFKINDIAKSKSLNLFIDCSYIFNKYGVNCIATNPEYRKKKVSKLSIVSDHLGTILGVHYDKTHKNLKNKNCFSHDLKLVQNTLDNININIAHNITTKLGGDKGYISQDSFKLNNNKHVKIIAPKRKNQKKRNTVAEIKYLKNRGVVERSIATLKQSNRTQVRKDKKIENYMGFVYLSLINKLSLMIIKSMT